MEAYPIVSFTIPGDPFGKQRPRHTKNGHTYTPKETKAHEDIVRAFYRKSTKYRFPNGTPLAIKIVAYYRIPTSESKKNRTLMISGDIRPTIKPDWDNIGKLVADALNGIAYEDDKFIVDSTVRKFYSEVPRTRVIISKALKESEEADDQ